MAIGMDYEDTVGEGNERNDSVVHRDGTFRFEESGIE